MTPFPATESSGCRRAWLTGHRKETGPIRVFCGSARIRELLFVLVGHELVTLDAVLLFDVYGCVRQPLSLTRVPLLR